MNEKIKAIASALVELSTRGWQIPEIPTEGVGRVGRAVLPGPPLLPAAV